MLATPPSPFPIIIHGRSGLRAALNGGSGGKHRRGSRGQNRRPKNGRLFQSCCDARCRNPPTAVKDFTEDMAGTSVDVSWAAGRWGT